MSDSSAWPSSASSSMASRSSIGARPASTNDACRSAPTRTALRTRTRCDLEPQLLREEPRRAVGLRLFARLPHVGRRGRELVSDDAAGRLVDGDREHVLRPEVIDAVHVGERRRRVAAPRVRETRVPDSAASSGRCWIGTSTMTTLGSSASRAMRHVGRAGVLRRCRRRVGRLARRVRPSGPRPPGRRRRRGSPAGDAPPRAARRRACRVGVDSFCPKSRGKKIAPRSGGDAAGYGHGLAHTAASGSSLAARAHERQRRARGFFAAASVAIDAACGVSASLRAGVGTLGSPCGHRPRGRRIRGRSCAGELPNGGASLGARRQGAAASLLGLPELRTGGHAVDWCFTVGALHARDRPYLKARSARNHMRVVRVGG